MCGIAGILSSRSVEAATLVAMSDRLRHRGPDDEGVWIDAAVRRASATGGWRSSTCRPPGISRCLRPTAASS